MREAAQLALEKAAHATKIEVPSAPPATFVAPAGKTAAARTQEPADADAAHTILLKAAGWTRLQIGAMLEAS